VVVLGLGLNVRNHHGLVSARPAIIVANHNSHLDTMVLISLLPLRMLNRVRPVAAMDYFLRNRLLAWFALKIVGIIPIARDAGQEKGDPLGACSEALERGEILVFFPEGTRGEPEKPAQFRNGVAHLAKRHPTVPVIPVFMHGLGKALPRGDFVLVPFFCDVVVGDPLRWTGDRAQFMDTLGGSMKRLAAQVDRPDWE